ncbi:MAG: patatin-like phospholipase family protein [candidate division WOR-3 bacterium]|nr:MAG: patatin-like phospholipase family protein [candidate division WOR-3 bacterium]
MQKKALVISGGGARGSWAAGALRWLIQDNNQTYDLVVGTSTGALISWAAALGKVDLLRDLYTNVSREDCLAPRCPLFGYGPVPNLHWALVARKDSLYRIERLEKRLRAALSEQAFAELKDSGREAAVCVVNLQTSEPEYFNSRDCERERFITAVMASSSIPVFMPRKKIEGHEQYWYVDGGVRDLLPLGYAIREGATDITAIFLSPKKQGSDKQYSAIYDVGLRTQNVYDSEVGKNDVNMGALITRELVWRRRLRQQLVSRFGNEQEVEAAFRAASAGFEPMEDEKTHRPFRAVSLRLLQPRTDIGPALEFTRDDMQRYEAAGYAWAKDPGNWDVKAEVPAA